MFVRVQHGLAFGQVSDRVSKVIPPVSLSLERRFEGQGAVAHSKVSRCEDDASLSCERMRLAKRALTDCERLCESGSRRVVISQARFDFRSYLEDAGQMNGLVR